MGLNLSGFEELVKKLVEEGKISKDAADELVKAARELWSTAYNIGYTNGENAVYDELEEEFEEE